VAACKFTPLPSTPPSLPYFSIKKASLPVTCRLNSPPAGVTIARARFYNAGGQVTTLDVSSDGESFTIPNTVAAGDGDLEVRVQVGPGGPDSIPTIYVVEDCDASQRIVTIEDSNSKLGGADVMVQS
jgi:hypothetical protein